MANKFSAITLEITKKCNHKCLFCYNLSSCDSEDVTLDKIDFIVDKISAYGIEYVTISGGEPYMVRPQTEYLIKNLLKKNIDVCLNTNLSLVNEETIKNLVELLGHNNMIYSSIPSVIAEKCDIITQNKGSYERIVNGVQLCRKYKMPLGLNMTVSKSNIEDLDYIDDFLDKNLVDSFTLFPVIPPFYDRRNSIHDISNNDLIKIANTLVHINHKYGIVVGSIRPLPLCVIGEKQEYRVIRGSRCTTGQVRCAIDMVSGEIEACSQEGIKYGNIYNDSLDESYKRMKDWRNGTFLVKNCKVCEKLDICGGVCLWSEPCGRC